jgi:hypothetical protein
MFFSLAIAGIVVTAARLGYLVRTFRRSGR